MVSRTVRTAFCVPVAVIPLDISTAIPIPVALPVVKSRCSAFYSFWVFNACKPLIKVFKLYALISAINWTVMFHPYAVMMNLCLVAFGINETVEVGTRWILVFTVVFDVAISVDLIIDAVDPKFEIIFSFFPNWAANVVPVAIVESLFFFCAAFI